MAVFITYAECARCGGLLRVYPGTLYEGDGHLYLNIDRNGQIKAEARHMNIQTCDEYLAAHPDPGSDAVPGL